MILEFRQVYLVDGETICRCHVLGMMFNEDLGDFELVKEYLVSLANDRESSSEELVATWF